MPLITRVLAMLWRGFRAYALTLVLAVALGLASLNSPIGHRLLADWLASQETERGLGVTIGRIEGSLFGAVRLDDVALRDPHGVFLRASVVELDWRPLAWLHHRLDIRRLVVRRATLLRRPALRPATTPAPMLPNFDIRLDRLVIERLTVARGLAGAERRVDARASIDLHHGRALLLLDSHLGGGDRCNLVLDADEARRHFDLSADYAAPKGGLIAALTGARASLDAKLDGRGTWADWRGRLIATTGAGTKPAPARTTLATLALSNHAGWLGISGVLHPGAFDAAALIPARLATILGPTVTLAGDGRLAEGTLAGALTASSASLRAAAHGRIDLHANAWRGLVIDAQSRSALALAPDSRIEDGRAHLTLDGTFAAPHLRGNASAARWQLGKFTLMALTATTPQDAGGASLDHGRWRLPLVLTAARAISGDATIDPRLVGLRGQLTLRLAAPALASDDILLTAPGIAARGVLRGDLVHGTYALAGELRGEHVALGSAGEASILAKGRLGVARGGGWSLAAHLTGGMTRIDSGLITSLAGDAPHFTAELHGDTRQRVVVTHASLAARDLSLDLTGARAADGTMLLTGGGQQARYGAFTIAARLLADGPHASLHLADPLPAVALRDTTLSLAPVVGGYALTLEGGSMLGPFAGALTLDLPAHGPARIVVHRLALAATAMTGALTLLDHALSGALTLAGGGVSGTIALAPQGAAQRIDATLAAHDARFGGDRGIDPAFTIAGGSLRVAGLILAHHSALTAHAALDGVSGAQFFLNHAGLDLKLADGTGGWTATLAGQRAGRFALQLAGDIAPGRLALSANGVFAGEAIAMAHPARLTQDDAGWRLAPSDIAIGGGRAVVAGQIGKDGAALSLALARLPLELADALSPDLGIGGTASGTISVRQARADAVTGASTGAPTGNARLMLRGLTRIGPLAASRPIDLALAVDLAATTLQARAVAYQPLPDTRSASAPSVIGRLQARVTQLPAHGTLGDRLRTGVLAAGLRYAGPADAVWRLLVVDDIALSGPITLAADVTGSLDAPRITGALAGDGLRLESPAIGTDITSIIARGGFAGARLTLTTLTGHTPGGGEITGSGTADFTGVGARAGDDKAGGHRAPAIDLKLAATRAQLINRPDLALAASGPLRLVSDGVHGTIAGRLAITAARWQLGQAPAQAALPDIATREIHRGVDRISPPTATRWRFLIDAGGGARIRVIGLGLDSEWGASLRLRGALGAPVILGTADMLSGSYEFAGQHFDLTRGHLTFADSEGSATNATSTGAALPDPTLDIAATSSANDITARVSVQGTALKPLITFTSQPPLPEEELLARLLFGTSVASISAPEALQLGAALAALHGGGGLDPINRLRSAIGLDRLRVVNADPTVPHQTGVAVGKYIGRRLYAEAVTDGRGYSASMLEYRLTRWLSLLGSISTIGRNNLNVRISHDY